MPTTASAYDKSLNGSNDAYLAKFSRDGSDLLFGTYFGGSGEDWSANCHNLALDLSGNAFIVGETTSPDPKKVLFATFMGDDKGGFRACTTDSQSSFIGVGRSNANWPVLNSPPYGGGGTDATIVKFTLP
jgi:hypothetical protein